MNASLVRERGGPDVGGSNVRPQIGGVINEQGQVSKFREMLTAVCLGIHLDLEVGNDGGQVGVYISLSVSVHGALHHRGAFLHTSQADSYPHARIIVTMHSNRGVGESLHYGRRDVLERGD